jgi:hypothetical protein
MAQDFSIRGDWIPLPDAAVEAGIDVDLLRQIAREEGLEIGTNRESGGTSVSTFVEVITDEDLRRVRRVLAGRRGSE